MQPELIGGRYRVLRTIGRGGMGEVWLCRDETLARDVAVKQVGLLPGKSVTDTARAMREARSTAALSHRNVVTVFDVVQEGDHIWLVMEFVPSRTLSQVIKDEGALSPGRVAGIGAQVADGLAAAHAAGITHRDVKPGNIFVGDDGSAKIGDFGISRTEGDPTLTQTGMMTGTPTYFSPELATGQDPSSASDVWALGASLYAAVEGRPPYAVRDNHLAVLHDIAHAPPPRPHKAGPLEPVLTRMLDRDPSTRWSMVDVAHRLHRIADGDRDRTASWTDELPAAAAGGAGPAAATAVSDRDATPPPAGPTPPTRDTPDTDEPHRRRGGPVLVGVLALAAAVLAVLLLNPFGADDTSDRDTTGADAGETPEPSDESSPRVEDPTAEASDPPASDAPTEQASDAPAEEPPPAGAVAFVDGYYDTVPEDLDAGWAMLSPDYQAEVTRSSYDGFWGTIDSADAQDLRTVAGGDAVEATVVFVNSDGETLTERHRIDLVDEGDGLRVAGDEPI